MFGIGIGHWDLVSKSANNAKILIVQGIILCELSAFPDHAFLLGYMFISQEIKTKLIYVKELHLKLYLVLTGHKYLSVSIANWGPRTYKFFFRMSVLFHGSRT